MATITVEKTHALGQDEAIKRAQEVTKDLAIKLNAEITWTPTGATFKGTGFTGTAKVTNDRVAVDVDLSLMLRPLKSTIMAKIEQKLSEKFA